MAFTGWPQEALTFYEGLEADNSKEYWTAHKKTYEQAVKAPMEALLAELEPAFGLAKIFRPNRDIRFSADKSPYKTHIGGTLGMGAVLGGYVQLGSDGLMVAGGAYEMAADQVQRLREAVMRDSSGAELEQLVASLEAKGYRVGGEALKTVPRGFPKDHPRVRFLRHKSLYAGKSFGRAPWLHGEEALEQVGRALEGLAPLMRWLAANVGPSELPPEKWGR